MTTTVGKFKQTLEGLPADQEVPAEVLLDALPSRYELSYVEAALSDWMDIAEMHGRDFHPEVDAFMGLLYRVL